ncbi:putative transcription factor C2H2 family protein, partial [Tanacetum coccineum]
EKLDQLENKGVVKPVDPYICRVCGRKFYNNEKLINHFKQIHEREHAKRCRDILTPNVGYGLGDELKRAGYWVSTVSNKPQAADVALRNHIVDMMDKRQMDCSEWRPNLNITGLELKAGDLWSFQAPKDWSGTLWGRTSCTFNRSGHGSCKTGDCGSGELECNGGSATPPVKLAKFTLSSFFRLDYLYVSLAKGYNLQMTVEATGCYEDSYTALPMWILTPEGQVTDGDKSTAWTPEFCYGYDLAI